MSELSPQAAQSDAIRDGNSEGRRNEFASFKEVDPTAEKEATGTEPYVWNSHLPTQIQS